MMAKIRGKECGLKGRGRQNSETEATVPPKKKKKVVAVNPPPSINPSSKATKKKATTMKKKTNKKKIPIAFPTTGASAAREKRKKLSEILVKNVSTFEKGFAATIPNEESIICCLRYW